MTKKELLSYIGKGVVNHRNKYMLNVTKGEKSGITMIDLKPINKHVKDIVFDFFEEYVKEEDLEKIEQSFEKEYEKMRRIEKEINLAPIKLKLIGNLHPDFYAASFVDDKKNKYVVMKVDSNYYEICTYCGEADYPINRRIEIGETIIEPEYYSFWNLKSLYKKEELDKAIGNEEENIEEEEMD